MCRFYLQLRVSDDIVNVHMCVASTSNFLSLVIFVNVHMCVASTFSCLSLVTFVNALMCVASSSSCLYLVTFVNVYIVCRFYRQLLVSGDI